MADWLGTGLALRTSRSVVFIPRVEPARLWHARRSWSLAESQLKLGTRLRTGLSQHIRLCATLLQDQISNSAQLTFCKVQKSSVAWRNPGFFSHGGFPKFVYIILPRMEDTWATGRSVRGRVHGLCNPNGPIPTPIPQYLTICYTSLSQSVYGNWFPGRNPCIMPWKNHLWKICDYLLKNAPKSLSLEQNKIESIVL